MKNFSKLFLLFLLIFGYDIQTSLAQGVEPDTVTIYNGGVDSIIYESPAPIDLRAISVVRFASNASAYIRWTAPAISPTGYTVRFKLLGASSWTSGSNSTLNKIISSLQLDTIYNVEILPTGVTNPSDYQANGLISTHSQGEPIVVSHEFFNELSAWFANESESRTFCELINEVDIPLFEKLSFLQKYVFDNESFSDGGSSTNFSDWYPSRHSGLDEDSCLPEWVTECRCKVISDGSNHASPGSTDFLNGEMIPKVVQKIVKNHNKRTYVDRFEAGAAKFIGLRQDDQVGMSFEMSNVGGGNDNTSVTPTASDIQFLLGCLVRDGGTGLNSNLPEECDCERPLHVSYNYVTHLLAMGEKKGCVFSKGAAAQAEDLAVVMSLDYKTGELTVLDAGKYMVSRKCDSGWNPDWWINLLDVGGSIAKYYAETAGAGNNIPTPQEIDDFLDALETLIGTPFANQSGSCGSTEGTQPLVSGNDNLTLLPNHPLRISLYSAYYARVRGYGCWRAKAGVASDYYLLGVVESEQTEDPECCADKFATYIVGSQQSDSAPSPANPSDVELDANKNIPTRLTDVEIDLALYSSWYNHHVNSFTGYIDDLTHDFDRLWGPSCYTDDPFQMPQIYYPVMESSTSGLAKENLTFDMDVKDVSSGVITLLDMSGRLVRTLYSGQFSPGQVHMDFETSNLPNGNYIVNCNIKGHLYNYPLLILNK